MRGRSGTVSSRLDPLGRRGVTKRFANPARSRATRGRENAWLEARSPLPLGRRGRPSKTTTTTRFSSGIPGRPVLPVPSPPFLFLRSQFFERSQISKRRRSLGTIVGGVVLVVGRRHVGDAVGIGAATAEVSKRGTARVNRKPTTSTRSLLPLSLLACGSLDRSTHTLLARIHRFASTTLAATTLTSARSGWRNPKGDTRGTAP